MQKHTYVFKRKNSHDLLLKKYIFDSPSIFKDYYYIGPLCRTCFTQVAFFCGCQDSNLERQDDRTPLPACSRACALTKKRLQNRVFRQADGIFAGISPRMNKKKRPALRKSFFSAGARTRTWSLLVRSQTLYPVGLHPRDVPKYRIIG